jgi:hypothetical protein
MANKKNKRIKKLKQSLKEHEHEGRTELLDILHERIDKNNKILQDLTLRVDSLEKLVNHPPTPKKDGEEEEGEGKETRSIGYTTKPNLSEFLEDMKKLRNGSSCSIFLPIHSRRCKELYEKWDEMDGHVELVYFLNSDSFDIFRV